MIRNLDDSAQVDGYARHGAVVIKGEARITGPGQIKVDDRELTMNTKIRLITRIAFGFASPDALIALASSASAATNQCSPAGFNPRLRQESHQKPQLRVAQWCRDPLTTIELQMILANTAAF